MEKVKIYATGSCTCVCYGTEDTDEAIIEHEYETEPDEIAIHVEEILRGHSSLNSFEDLIGMIIEDVEYKNNDIILTLERRS